MKFISYEETAKRFEGKSVVIVGSGPGCLENDGAKIDSYDLIVRVNNYKMRGHENLAGSRTDVFYSYFGGAIRKSAEELTKDGVKLCMSKCPDARIIESEWHIKNNQEAGIDFRKLYTRRANWWFCPTYAPTLQKFLEYFDLLGKHIPTTGFSCILDILSFQCSKIYITGFDFFKSGIHNVNERWVQRNLDDPIRHMPELERDYMRKLTRTDVTYDSRMQRALWG